MKKYFKYQIILFYLSGFFFHAFSQNLPNIENDFETIIESIADDLNDEADYLSILENLEFYFENPLNINTASEEDLKRLSLLNEIQINNLLEFHKNSGEIYSIYELNSIEGFNREILEKIAPFIKFETAESSLPTIDKPFKYGKNQLLIRTTRVMPKAKGYKSDKGEPQYEGSPERIYTRYSYLLEKKISIGMTAEKDPGEAFFTGSNKKGFDYYSGHFSMGFNSFLKNITIGDFQVHAGQGLMLWQGYSGSKSADVLNISKNASGIRPYTSTDENKFFRGVSAKFEFQNLGMQFFSSFKNKDANLEYTDSLNSESYFTSLQTSGLHRTKNEITDKKSITEITSGGLISYQKNRLKVGSAIYYQKFNMPLQLDDTPYNLFRFEGNQNMNFGIDYRYLSGKYHLFGEATISKSYGIAYLQGIIAYLHDRATVSILFRHFDKNYHSFFSNAFSEATTNINETGLYFGLKLLPAPKLRVLAYSDFYKFPWISYTTSAPSNGHEVYVQVEYQHSTNFQMYLRLKDETKETKIHEDHKYINEPSNTKKIRLHLQYSLSESIQLKSRFEYIYYKKYETENGFMGYQDFIYSPVKIPLKCYLRIAFFNTDSYNSRIYTYENDLLYNYSIPSFYDQGIRTYLNFTYKFSNLLEVWLKLSKTNYNDSESIGSGYNEVEGKSLTEVKIQLRLKF